MIWEEEMKKTESKAVLCDLWTSAKNSPLMFSDISSLPILIFCVLCFYESNGIDERARADETLTRHDIMTNNLSMKGFEVQKKRGLNV